MNQTERAAHAWLQIQGYRAEHIAFTHSRSPDFITADGRGWEVKRLTGRTITFEARQICDIQHLGATTVLIWVPDGREPEAVCDFAELTIPGEWKGYLLRAQWQPSNSTIRGLHTVEAVNDVVARYVAQGRLRKAMPLEAA